jgi:phosphotransferase system enzyme I (PtsI)/phosphotransferase system enzyme I (PtsP)
LGWRGIRFSLDNSQLLMTQLRAIMRSAKNEIDLHILIPMVSSTEDVDQFRHILDEAIAQLTAEKVDFMRPKIGVMIEVPAAISLLPHWKDKIDFISIGSNDLSQYLLALDRGNVRVASRFDHAHPAIISEIFRVVKIAKQLSIPVSVCGEMAADPVSVILLVAMGIRRLSMSSSKIPRIKHLIRSLSADCAVDFLTQALALSSTAKIRQLGEVYMNEHHLNDMRQVAVNLGHKN